MTDTRLPLDADRLRGALGSPTGPFSRVDVVAETRSTNDSLTLAARQEPGRPLVLFAERQTAGRGRLGRSWEAPARSAVLMSALFAFDVPPTRVTWLPLIAGLACVEVLQSRGVAARAKWPNDILVPDPHGAQLSGWGAMRKVGGVLVRAVAGGAVVGVGLNVDQAPSELPVRSATSLSAAGARQDRTDLAIDLAGALYRVVARWSAAGGEPGPLAERCASALATLGSRVAVDRVDGTTLLGTAVGLGPDGALLVRGEDGTDHRVTGGDVRHLRAGAGAN